jgi:hypothetical protein
VLESCFEALNCLCIHKWNFFHFDLKLENLQQRRTSLRLVFLYKVVEGLVPAINPSEFLVPLVGFNSTGERAYIVGVGELF